MLKKMGVPRLADVEEQPAVEAQAPLLDHSREERLAQLLEEQLQPIIKEAILDAVRDSARRLARDLRKRLDAEIGLMIREAVDEAVYHEAQGPRPTKTQR